MPDQRWPEAYVELLWRRMFFLLGGPNAASTQSVCRLSAIQRIRRSRYLLAKKRIKVESLVKRGTIVVLLAKLVRPLFIMFSCVLWISTDVCVAGE